MTDFEGSRRPEEIRGRRISGQGLECERRDKPAGMFRHDHPDLRSSSDQFTDQLRGLVRGDPSGDAQNDSSALQHFRHSPSEDGSVYSKKGP